jgi:integrase
MFRLAEIAGKVAHRPYIPMLREDNARKGFFEAPEFEAVLAELPGDLKPIAQAAYVTGWRIRSELLNRQWSHVDFQAGWIRLEPGETENREDRMFPMTPTLRAVLERQRRERARLNATRTGWSRGCSIATGSPSSTSAGRGSPPARRLGCRSVSRTTSGARPSGTWSEPVSRGRPP